MRSIEAAVMLTVAALVIACTTAASPGPTANPTDASALPAATQPATPSVPATSSATPGPTPGATPAASQPTSEPSASPAESFRLADVVSIEVEELPVHVAPTTTSASMLGFRQGQPIGELRLGMGDYVSVQMGPLPVDGDAWYLVWPAEGGELGYSLTYWQPAGEDGGSYPGWVQATDAGRPLLELHRRHPADDAPGGPFLVASGDADYVSPPQPRHDLFTLNWAAAANAGPCQLAMRLVPVDGPDPVVAVAASIDSVAQGPISGPDSVIATGWPMDDAAWESYVVRVTSGCPWTFALVSLGHD